MYIPTCGHEHCALYGVILLVVWDLLDVTGYN